MSTGAAPSMPAAAGALDPKRLATLTAQCALVGVQLHAMEDDHGLPLLVVTKWAMSRQFHCLDEAELWVERFAGVRTGRAEAE